MQRASNKGFSVRPQKTITTGRAIIIRIISDTKSQGFPSKIPAQLITKCHNRMLKTTLCAVERVLAGLITSNIRMVPNAAAGTRYDLAPGKGNVWIFCCEARVISSKVGFGGRSAGRQPTGINHIRILSHLLAVAAASFQRI